MSILNATFFKLQIGIYSAKGGHHEQENNQTTKKCKHLPSRQRVAAYARVSCGKDEILHSLAAQVSFYSKLIQSKPEWEYICVYADEAETGTKNSISEFQRLIADSRAERRDLILTNAVITKGQF